MAERRTTRTKRRDEDDELVEPADDELAEDEDGELAEPADDELAEDEDGELAEDEDGELAEDEDGELAEDEDESQQGARDGGSRRRSRPDRDAGVTAAKAGQLALRQIAELTGKSAEGVTGVEPSEDGWVVGVEVVEDKRIPSSTDILATYETELGMDGDLVSYRRVKRYTRGRGDSEDS